MTATGSRPAGRAGARRLNLTLATIGFLVNFWAWALLGPLGPGIKERLGLSFAAQSLLVAVPVVVGSLGRIPVGALTDRFGARIMFPIVSLATIVPVLTLAYVQSSYWAMIVVGFFLGIGGTAFAVGVPHVSGWYPPARRGFAHRRVRRRHGRHRHLQLHHRQARQRLRDEAPVLPRRRDPRRLRRASRSLLLRDAPGRTPSAVRRWSAPPRWPG